MFCLLLDCKNRLIRKELVAVGTLDSCVIHPREVFAPAIQEAAASIIVLHNHPSGSAAPSEQDIGVTRRLYHVGKLIGINLIDHIIVSDSCYSSFVEEEISPFANEKRTVIL